MKNVTDLFKESCNADIVSCMVKIEISYNKGSNPIATLSGDDFIENSIRISSQTTSYQSFTIGGVCSSRLNLTLTRKGVSKLKDSGAFRKGLCWRVIQWNKVNDDNQDSTDFSVNIDGSKNTSGKCKLGVFYVSKINNDDYSCDIEAYDGMLAFEKSINATKLKFMRNNLKTPGEWVEYIVNTCRTLGYAFSYNMADNLVNQNLQVKISDDVSVKTFREALGYLTILVGGFATFNEDGDLLIRTYDYTPVELTMSHKRLLSGKFDNDVSEITGFYSSVAGFDYENVVTNANIDNAVDIYVSENPFLRGIQEYNKTEANPDILDALTNISDSLLTKLFYGCDITVTAMPYIDLGDCLSVSRLIVSESGVSSDVINSNIIVCDMTYNFGSSLSIKSRSTSGTSSSSTTGDIGSNPKETSGKDGRVDELIDAFTGIKYEYRTVMIPIKYDRAISGSSEYNIVNKVRTDVTYLGSSAYDIKQKYNISNIVLSDVTGRLIDEDDLWSLGAEDTLLDAYRVTGKSSPVLGMIKDNLDDMDSIRITLSFSETKKITGIISNEFNNNFAPFTTSFDFNYSETPLDGDGNEYKEKDDLIGSYWRQAKVKYPGNVDDNYWLVNPLCNAIANIDYTIDDGGFKEHSIFDSGTLVNLSAVGNWKSVKYDNAGVWHLGGSSFSFSTPNIVTQVFAKSGNKDEKELDIDGVYDDYTSSELASIFSNDGCIDIRIGASLPNGWNNGSGKISGEMYEKNYSGNNYEEGISRNTDMSEWRQDVSLYATFGTYGKFINCFDNKPSYAIMYSNLPQFVKMTYRVKVEVKEDINAVIDAINQGVSANEDVSSVNEAVILLGDRVTDLSDDVTSLRNEVTTMQSDIASLRSCCNDVKSSIETLNTGYSNLENSINGLNSAVSGLSGSVDSITSRLDAIDLAIAVIPDIQSSISSLDARVTALEQGGGGPTVDYRITNLWFEDTAGFRFDDYIDSAGRYRIPTGVSFYISISLSEAGSTNSFYATDGSSDNVKIGDDTSSTKSTSTVISSSSELGYFASAVWDGSHTATSATSNVLGFNILELSESNLDIVQDGDNISITVNPSNGYPSVGFGNYEYKFVLCSSEDESSEVSVLKDWSTDNTCSFVLGSEEVSSLTNLWIRTEVRDLYSTTSIFKNFIKTINKSITGIWFEDANGFKFRDDNAMDSDGNIRIVTSTPFNICISTSDAGSLNSFYKVSTTAAEGKLAIGEETNTNKSTETVTPSSGGVEYFAEAYWSDDDFRAVSEKRKVVSVSKLKAPVSSTVVNKSGSNCSFKIVASNGYPSVGIGQYEYKFVLASSSTQTSEIKVLQDWSASDTCEFVLGSDEVNNLTSLFIRYYVRDIYTESYYGYKKFTL